MPLHRIVFEDDAVVLIRVDEILPPAARAHDDHGVPNGRRASARLFDGLRHFFGHAAVDVVVHVREQRLNLRRGEVVFEKLLRHDCLHGLHLLQAVELGNLRECVDVLHDVRGRHGHGVLQVEQAQGAVPLIHHRHVAVS